MYCRSKRKWERNHTNQSKIYSNFWPLYLTSLQKPRRKTTPIVISDDEDEEDYDDDSDKENVQTNSNCEDKEFKDNLDELIEKFQQKWWDITSGITFIINLKWPFSLVSTVKEPRSMLIEWIQKENLKLIPNEG